MPENKDWGLIQSFDIDGKLDDIPPHEAFVLGFEYCEVYKKIQEHIYHFKHLIHTHNLNRLTQLCHKYNLTITHTPDQDGWVTIIVKEQTDLPTPD